MHLLYSISLNTNKPLNGLTSNMWGLLIEYYREDILKKGNLYNQTPPKNIPILYRFQGCLCSHSVVGVNGFEDFSPNHSHLQPYACFKTPENVTRWEYFSGVFDCISFLTYGCPLYSYSMGLLRLNHKILLYIEII